MAASIIGGYPNGNFGPDDLVIRQQFAKMIVLTLDLPVTEDDWPDAAALHRPGRGRSGQALSP